MKRIKYPTPIMAAMFMAISSVTSQAAITVTGFAEGAFDDVNSDSFSYTVQNTNSVLVIGFYTDATEVPTSITFGGVAADAFFSSSASGRTHIAYWDNLAVGSGTLAVEGIVGGFGGSDLLVGAFELAGVDLSATVTGSIGSTITTPTDNEFVISFGGRNSDVEPTVGGSSIIDTGLFGTNSTEIIGGTSGGGSVAGGYGLAGLAGSQDVSWNNAANGIVSYSFVPEPSSLALLGLGGLGLALRRRRS